MKKEAKMPSVVKIAPTPTPGPMYAWAGFEKPSPTQIKKVSLSARVDLNMRLTSHSKQLTDHRRSVSAPVAEGYHDVTTWFSTVDGETKTANLTKRSEAHSLS
jgi:hypothetical protein